MAEFKKLALQGLYAQYQRDFRPLDKDLFVLLEDLFRNLDNLLNGGLNFNDNLETAQVSYTTHATPDTEEAKTHTLGKIPVGFFVTDIDKAAVVYRGPTAFTATTIYLKCSVASVAVKVRVF